MASHTVKMFTSFILLAGCLNLTYYATYWKYPQKSHALHRKYRHDEIQSSIDDNNYRDEPKLTVPLLKVILMRGPNKNLIKKKIKVTWTPEYICENNDTNSRQKSVAVSPQDAGKRPNNLAKITRSTRIPLCPEVPPSLGLTKLKESVNLAKMSEVFSKLQTGGSYTPGDCVPTENVAIIVPYRGDETPLLLFVYSVHLTVTQQKLAYQIFVIKEYNTNKPLNPGLLYNVGFIESQKYRSNITCMIFHDPYLAPKDSRNLYRCSDQPKQLVAFVDNDPEEVKFGGVIAMRPQVFRAANGFSSNYLDRVFEEMYQRLIAANYTIIRSPPKHAIYNSLLTGKEFTDPATQTIPAVPAVSKKTVTSKELPVGGLAGLTYTMTYPEELSTYTLIEVDSKQPQYVTISTKSSNPLYDETTTPSTTTPIAAQMSLQARSRMLG